MSDNIYPDSLLDYIMGKDFVSLLNAIFGFYSIFFFVRGRIEVGIYMLILAFVMDTLDGEVARRLFETTEFGKRMDMADLISFGVAPAVFLFVWISPTTSLESLVLHSSMVCLISAEILRLARFQTRESDESHFLGLPGTANGVIYPLLYVLNPGLYPVVIITFLVSILMVSSIRFPVKPKRLK